MAGEFITLIKKDFAPEQERPQHRIESLAKNFSEAVDSKEKIRIEAIALDQDVQALTFDDLKMKQQAVLEISKHDPEIDGLVKDRARYLSRLDEIIKILSAEKKGDLNFHISDLSQFSKIEKALRQRNQRKQSSGRRVVDRSVAMQMSLQRGGESGKTRALHIAQQTYEQVESSDFLWDYFVYSGDIPPHFLDDFESLTNLIKLKDIYQIADSSSLTARQKSGFLAQHYLPLIQDGDLNEVLAEEVIEGNFEFNHDFEEAVIAGFLGLWEAVESAQSRKVSLKTKLSLAALASMLILSLSSSTLSLKTYDQHPYLPIVELNPELTSKKDDSGPEILSNGDEKSEGGHQLEGRSETKAGEGKKGNPEAIEAGDASSVENNNKLREEKIWEIEGGLDPQNLYRTATADEFDGWFRWRFNRNDRMSYDFSASSKDPEEQEAVMTLTASFDQVKSMAIPIPYGYVPIFEEVRLTVNGAQVPKSVDLYGDGSVSVNPEYSQELDEEGSIEVDLIKGQMDLGQSEKPSQEARANSLDLDSLPREVRVFLQDLKANEGLTLEKKAEEIRKFTQDYFTYSLNPTYSDYYLSADDREEFFQRFFIYKKGDCDVVNTAQVMMQRYVGIPSRMAFGFKNDEFVLNKDARVLDSTERHGWAEVYIEGEWLSMDGTPIDMDQYSRNLLEEKMGIKPSFSIPEGSLKEQLQRQMLSIKNWVESHQEVQTLMSLAAIATWLALGLRDFLLRLERRDAEFRKIAEGIQEKAAHIYGREGNISQEVRHFFLGFAGVDIEHWRQDSLETLLLPVNVRFLLDWYRKNRAMKVAKEGLDEMEVVQEETALINFLVKITGEEEESIQERIKADNIDSHLINVRYFLENRLRYALKFYPIKVNNISSLLSRIDKMAQESNSPVVFFEQVLKRLYEFHKNRRQRKRMLKNSGVRPFPDSYDEFRQEVGGYLKRPLYVLWGIVHGKM